MMIRLDVLFIALELILYTLARRNEGLPFSPGTLGRDFLLNVPALLYIFILGARFRQSKHTPSNKTTYFTLIILPYISVFIIFVPLLFNPLMNIYVGETGGLRHLLIPAILSDLMLMLMFSFSYVYTRVMQTRLNLLRAEREKARFQFQLLKNQMNPHFLFNALNVAASLPYEDAEKANLFIKQLGVLYRKMLQTSDMQVVSLQSEKEFVDSYIYLEKVRFENKLQVSTDIDETLMERKVVPGCMQMLIENAVKHNTLSEDSPLKVDIRADREGITVSNNVQLRDPVALPGRGLRNLRQQYAQLGRDIEVEKGKERFVVRLPFI